MILARWSLGIVAGTILIAITSPLFVRSYVPRIRDPQRNVTVLSTGANYRWRAEGYATTKIGPMGMPGQLKRPGTDTGWLQIALWGDSQAEGVCVDDQHKIHSIVEGQAEAGTRCFPFARSGDNCNDWLAQIESIAQSPRVFGQINIHLFLVVEWDDWSRPVAPPQNSILDLANSASDFVPAFVIQAARNAVTSGPDSQLRSLRFHPGPVQRAPAAQIPPKANSTKKQVAAAVVDNRMEMISSQLNRLRQVTDSVCLFAYAPLRPSIESGKIVTVDPDHQLFCKFQRECDERGFLCVDVRSEMITSVDVGQWPRGFHNGQYGVGHYNRRGNEIIASAVVRELGKLNATPDRSGF